MTDRQRIDSPGHAARSDDSASRLFRWLVTRVGTRAAAVGWWMIMAVIAIVVANWWVGLIQDPTPAGVVFVVGVTAVVAVPFVHEMRHAVPMAQRIITGT